MNIQEDIMRVIAAKEYGIGNLETTRHSRFQGTLALYEKLSKVKERTEEEDLLLACIRVLNERDFEVQDIQKDAIKIVKRLTKGL